MAPGVFLLLAQSQMCASQRPVRLYWLTPMKQLLLDFGPERDLFLCRTAGGADVVRFSIGPRLATLFFVPVWEVASGRLGECAGGTHEARMARAAEALAASPHFRASRGRDHFLVSSMLDAFHHGVNCKNCGIKIETEIIFCRLSK